MSDKFKVSIDKDLEEIVPTFLDNRQKDIIAIKEYLENSDIDQIEVIAHKLAGNAGSYGFMDLGLIGADLEKACKEKNLEIIRSKYTEYCQYMTNLEVEFS